MLARGRPWRGGRRHCLALAAPERPWWLRDAGAVMTLQPWEGRRERECGLAMITSGVRQALRTGEREKASDCKARAKGLFSAVEQGREALHLFILVGYRRRFECLWFNGTIVRVLRCDGWKNLPPLLQKVDIEFML